VASVDLESLWSRLRRRKVVQWGIAYAAGAWGLLQGLEYVIDTFHWPAVLQPLVTMGLLIGLPIVLVIAWYHGDRGQQRVTATEFVIITLLFLIGGAMFWRYDRASDEAAVTAGTPGAAAGAQAPESTAPANSIAVLPFVNMSKDKDNEYFSDGISEEILNSLAQVPDLQVAARTSSFSFKGQTREIPDIARELKVRMVLEGSVRKQDERVRITAQLIDASNGFHVWSQTYDRELEDIFAIQDEIARAIAGALRIKLSTSPATGPEKSATMDVAAYEFYLKGLSLWQARGQDNLDQAQRHFEQAIERDPKFAKAWAGVALVETLRPDWFGTPSSISYPRARDAAERALALDPLLPEAYAALANTAFNEGRSGTARELFERALAIAPSYATAWQWYGWGLMTNGYFEDALPKSQRAVELDPKASIVRQDLAIVLFNLGRLAEAEAICEKILSEPADKHVCWSLVFESQLARKNYAAARVTLRNAAEPRGVDSVRFVDQLMDAVEGKTDPGPLAARLLPMPDGLFDRQGLSPLLDADAIYWFIAVGRPADAVARLRRTAETLPGVARAISVDPGLDAIRCRADFQAIQQQIAFTDPRTAGVCGSATTMMPPTSRPSGRDDPS
jgi:TolB-like protein/cytochrome c-type biogenesis protein CcmH/NrfG